MRRGNEKQGECQMRLVLLTSTVLFALSGSAVACTSQSGRVVFEDNFTNNNGNWKILPPAAEIKGGALQLRPKPNSFRRPDLALANPLNMPFEATEADYCIEFVVSAPVAGVAHTEVGMTFCCRIADRDAIARYVSIDTNGLLKVGTLTSLATVVDYHDSEIFRRPTEKLEPGTLVSLRLIAKSDELAAFVNGKKINTVDVPPTSPPAANDPAFFGVFASVENGDAVIKVKSLKVTAGE
jgi:hypothetical protein